MKRITSVLCLMAAAGCASTDGAPGRGLEIYWVDVEGGAATLIVAPSGESLLVDTGNPDKPDRSDAGRIHHVATKVAGLKRIDHLVTTHWHGDHWGGLGKLAELMPIGTFYDHGFPEGEHRDISPPLKEVYLKVTKGKAVRVKPGDTIPLKGVDVRVVVSDAVGPGEKPGAHQTRACEKHPPQKEDTSDNARSVGFILTFGDFDFLDLGDTTWNVEHKLVCPKNLIGTVDVYQVTHHGLANSNNPALVKAVAPTVAIMNNGPRKGGKATVYRTLTSTPSIKDVFQLHRNVDTGDADNAPPAFVANDTAKCEGAWVKLSVVPSGKSYTVEVPSKGTQRTYASKNGARAKPRRASRY